MFGSIVFLSLCHDVGLFTISADEKIQFQAEFKETLLGCSRK